MIQNIKRYRKTHNLSQIAFSKLIGKSHGYISNIENGKANPSKKMKKKIQAVLANTVAPQTSNGIAAPNAHMMSAVELLGEICHLSEKDYAMVQSLVNRLRGKRKTN